MKGSVKIGLILVSLLLMMPIGGFCAKVATLPELTTPMFMTLDDEQIYIVQKAEILVYSLKDFKLKHKFGKAGEGPREFKVSGSGEGIQVFPRKDFLVITSSGRMSYFSKDGKYIEERKVPVFGQAPSVFQPVGDKFIGNGGAQENNTGTIYLTVNLYDAQMKKIKEISRMAFMSGSKLQFPMPALLAYVSDDKIIVLGDKDGISIKILDAEGKTLTEIHKEYKPLKMTEEYKKATHEMFKKHGDTKRAYDFIKQMLAFKDEFPPIQYYFVADKKIYVATYLNKGENYEFFVFDFKGKQLTRTFLPIKFMMGIRPNPMNVKNNKLYQLVDNEEDEVWELHTYEFK